MILLYANNIVIYTVLSMTSNKQQTFFQKQIFRQLRVSLFGFTLV